MSNLVPPSPEEAPPACRGERAFGVAAPSEMVPFAFQLVCPAYQPTIRRFNFVQERYTTQSITTFRCPSPESRPGPREAANADRAAPLQNSDLFQYEQSFFFWLVLSCMFSIESGHCKTIATIDSDESTYKRRFNLLDHNSRKQTWGGTQAEIETLLQMKKLSVS